MRRPPIPIACAAAFVLAFGVVLAIGLGVSKTVQNEKYNDQLLQTSLKASNWGKGIQGQFRLLKSIAESAAGAISFIADRLPKSNGTLDERLVRLDATKFNDLGDRIFATYPGLLKMYTFSDMVFSDCYPYHEGFKNALGTDLADMASVGYFHDVKADGVPRLSAKVSNVSDTIVSVTSRVLLRDPRNPKGPQQFFGVVSVAARLSFLVDVVFGSTVARDGSADVSIPTAAGYVAELKDNGTAVLATSLPPHTTPLWQDDDVEVIQNLDIPVASGDWEIRVRPINGWKGGLRTVDVIVSVAAALAAGLLSVWALNRYLRWWAIQTARDAEVVRSEAHLEFAGYIYHEIRNPTQSILATLDLAPPEMQRLPDYKILRSATTMIRRLLDSALDVLKLDNAKTVLELGPIDLVDLVNDCIAMTRPRLSDDQDIHVTIDASVPSHVLGDSLRLQQVLMNLLSNAVKYCRSQVQVHVGIDPDALPDPQHHALMFTVSDDGKGLDYKAREKLFLPFMQAASSTTREHGGTGLGLCISKGFVDLMGGTITCDSTPGSTTVFTVRLPLAHCDTSSSTCSSSIQTFAVEDTDTTHLKILFVDDVEILRTLGKRIMQRWGGSSCSVAVDGADALHQYEDALRSGTPFDVVFMDLQMPVMDGWCATAAIRELERQSPLSPPAWIAALSGSCVQKDIDAAFASGVDEFLAKPCTIQTCRQTLAGVARRRAPIHENESISAVNPLSDIERAQKQL